MTLLEFTKEVVGEYNIRKCCIGIIHADTDYLEIEAPHQPGRVYPLAEGDNSQAKGQELRGYLMEMGVEIVDDMDESELVLGEIPGAASFFYFS